MLVKSSVEIFDKFWGGKHVIKSMGTRTGDAIPFERLRVFMFLSMVKQSDNIGTLLFILPCDEGLLKDAYCKKEYDKLKGRDLRTSSNSAISNLSVGPNMPLYII